MECVDHVTIQRCKPWNVWIFVRYSRVNLEMCGWSNHEDVYSQLSKLPPLANPVGRI